MRSGGGVRACIMPMDHPWQFHTPVPHNIIHQTRALVFLARAFFTRHDPLSTRRSTNQWVEHDGFSLESLRSPRRPQRVSHQFANVQIKFAWVRAEAGLGEGK